MLAARDMRSLRLIGREHELAELTTRIDRARNGESSALVVRGPSGAGKTTLIEAAIARASGFTVLRATAAEFESELAYAGLAELLAPVLELRDALPRPQGAALERALALSDEGSSDRFAVGAGVLSLLGAAAERAPVLCAVDDAQWLDAATAAVVRFAARRLGNEGVFVLLGAREELDPRPLPSLAVEPLGVEDASRLVRALRPGVDAEVLRRIVETAGGNPLALAEVVTALTPEQLRGELAPEEPLRPGGGTGELLAARLRALPERSREALLVLAAAGDAPWEPAFAALGLAPADLEPAEDATLVEVAGGDASFRHPLARAAAYHEATAPRRRRAHAAVAGVLARDDPRRAWHLAAAAAGRDESVAAELERAAARARRQGGYAGAGRAHRRAAELSPDPRPRPPAGRRGRGPAACRLPRVGGAGGAAGARARGRRRGARRPRPHAARRRRAVSRSTGVRARHVPRSGGGRAGSQAGPLATQAALASMVAGDVRGWQADADLASELLEASPMAPLARALSGVARIAAGEGRGGRERLERAVDPAAVPARLRSAPVPPPAGVEIHTLAAQALVWLEEWDLAGALVDALTNTLREIAAVTALVYPLCVRAWLDVSLARWDSALAVASEAIRLGEETEQWIPLTGALGIRAWIHALRGDASGCRADAELALHHAERLGSPVTMTYSQSALGLLALGEGNMEQAIQQFGVARKGCQATGMVHPGTMPFTLDLVEAHIRAGHPGEAERLLESRRPVAPRRRGCRPLRGAARSRRRVRGAVRPRAGRPRACVRPRADAALPRRAPAARPAPDRGARAAA